MASITKDENGKKRIEWVDEKKRRRIRLGKIAMRDAEEIKRRIESILSANLSGRGYDNTTAEWLEGIPDSLAEKLVSQKLISHQKQSGASTLKKFLDDYVSRRDTKTSTKDVWSRAITNLIDYFGADRDLQTINPGHADDFKAELLNQGLATTTIKKRLEHARMFFRDALKRELISANPFSEVSIVATMKPGRQHHVTDEEIQKVMTVCDRTWRTIIALSRYGGLRCPSEVIELRWEYVNFETKQIFVDVPKLEYRPDKKSRVIPLFSELEPILADAFAAAPDGAEYVMPDDIRNRAIGPKGYRNCNLRQRFTRLIKRAGVKPWPKPFNNLRASRETDLAREYPVHVLESWLGHSTKIASKHYLMVTDDDFNLATEGAKSGAQEAQNQAQHPAAPSGTLWRKATQLPGGTTSCASERDCVRDGASSRHPPERSGRDSNVCQKPRGIRNSPENWHRIRHS